MMVSMINPMLFWPSLLPVGKADAGTGNYQNTTHPPDRRPVFRRFVEVFVVCDVLEQQIERTRQDEPEHW